MQKLVEFKTTDVFNRLADLADKRIICLYGGSSSSKTISALQFLTMYGEESTTPLVITVIGESIPVLKRSVLRDWQAVVMQEKFVGERFNKVDLTYYFPYGSIMQFIPADDPARFHAIRHDIVLIDEAYNVKKDIFDQVEIRTRGQILLTWNPVAPFWATKLQDQRDDVGIIHATYKDNPFLEQNIINALETRAGVDPNFYRVYVLGEYGSLEGLIFKEGTNWQKCDEMPSDFARRVLCLDFGFTYDPTALIDLRYSDGQFWIDQLTYSPGLVNSEIAERIKGADPGQAETIADAAEPKSIEEIRRLGVNIRPSEKGPDSVNYGLKLMQGFKLNVTKRSTDVIKELRNYSYQKNREGVHIDKPVKNWDHAIDAIRYGIMHIRQKPNLGKYSIT